MLTDRGRWILAFGGGIYLAAWAFGTIALYPIGLGLVLAVAAAAIWVRLLNRPMRVNRLLGQGEHLAGDDIAVRLELDVAGWMPSGALMVVERIAKVGELETVVLNRHGRLRGSYLLEKVPRGRYPIESATAVLEDPFGLERVEISLPAGEKIVRQGTRGDSFYIIVNGTVVVQRGNSLLKKYRAGDYFGATTSRGSRCAASTGPPRRSAATSWSRSSRTPRATRPPSFSTATPRRSSGGRPTRRSSFRCEWPGRS